MHRFGRLVFVTFVTVAMATAACGKDRSGGPRGDATSIVMKSPDITAAAGRAKVHVATPNATGDGTVDFGGATAHVAVRPGNQPEPEFANPALALDIVRSVVSVLPYGGAEVRGASTIKYEVDVAPPPDLLAKLGQTMKHDTFYADVFVDSKGRVRELARPIDLNEPRPSQSKQILAKQVTVDFYDFGGTG